MTMPIGSISSIPALDAVPSVSASAATVQGNGAGAAKGSSQAVGSQSEDSQSEDSQSVGSAGAAATAAATTGGGVSASLSSGTSASQSSSRALSPLDEVLAAVYTTSVGGHNYSGTVQQAAGEYVASAADPPAPPFTGVGASIQAAENNLTVVIDEMA